MRFIRVEAFAAERGLARRVLTASPGLGAALATSLTALSRPSSKQLQLTA
jgi:hypothetical protein